MSVSHTKAGLLCMSLGFFGLLHTYCYSSFGGTDGQYHYNDTWSFDLQTKRWSELQCIGFIPSPREGHAAAIVDDVIYIFGGRGLDGKDLNDLSAFKISSENCCLLYYPRSFRIFYRSTMVYVPEYGTVA